MVVVLLEEVVVVLQSPRLLFGPLLQVFVGVEVGHLVLSELVQVVFVVEVLSRARLGIIVVRVEGLAERRVGSGKLSVP